MALLSSDLDCGENTDSPAQGLGDIKIRIVKKVAWRHKGTHSCTCWCITPSFVFANLDFPTYPRAQPEFHFNGMICVCFRIPEATILSVMTMVSMGLGTYGNLVMVRWRRLIITSACATRGCLLFIGMSSLVIG